MCFDRSATMNEPKASGSAGIQRVSNAARDSLPAARLAERGSWQVPSGRPGERTRIGLGMPHSPSPGFGISLPLGVTLHGALLVLLLHPSFEVRSDQLPAFEAYRVHLFAPPAAALRLGDPAAEPEPEHAGATVRDTAARLAPLFARTDLVEVLEAVEIPSSFGSEHGIPDGFWEGLEFGEPAGVVGGIPGGVQGGQIGGLREAADPVLPPPDEPPAALSMPRPPLPQAGAPGRRPRARCPASPDHGARNGRCLADSPLRPRTGRGSHSGRGVGVAVPPGPAERPAGGLAQQSGGSLLAPLNRANPAGGRSSPGPGGGPSLRPRDRDCSRLTCRGTEC